MVRLAVFVLFLLASAEGLKNCSEPCLIYSATSQINAMELTTSRVVQVLSNLSRAVALDVHVREKTIYWSDINRRVIQRMNLTGGQIEDIITDDLGIVDGLAVEWESNLIYWADYSNSRVEVASLDGKNRMLLFVENVQKPRGIALYPKKGLMFWTDWGSTPKIERASLAGHNRTLLVNLASSGQNWPNAIFVDYTEDRIYWIDAWIDAIDSTDLNGNNRRLITNPIHPAKNMHPFDFAVYGGILYWSDWNTDSIERLNWTTAAYLGGFGILTSDRVFGVALLDQSRQPASAGNQLCKVNNGGCSHLCLLTPGGYQCACPDGLPLKPDGKTCLTEFSKFLLFAEGRNIRQLPLDVNVNTSLRIRLTKAPQRPVALDYNFQDEKVYWTDTTLDTISRAFLNGSSQETVVSSRIRYPYGLAVDSFGQNLYWTDSTENVIEVASLKGPYRRVLVNSNLQDPRDIALDVTRGYMYWTDWGISERIEKADMDGQSRSIVISTGIYYPNGLALDLKKNWMYWVDRLYDKLEVYEFPTNTRRQIISSYGHPYLSSPIGLAIYENHLFWTDWTWDRIYRADRQTGGNVVKVLSTQSQPMLIHAYDKNTTVTPVTDQCSSNNGGCSQLCLLAPSGKKCACSDGQVLDSDGTTCQGSMQLLLFADAGNSKIIKVPPSDPGLLASVPLSSSIISRPVALDYDVVEGRVYWTDVTMNTISRSFLNGSMQEVIINQNLQTPDGLAVDPAGRNLYWTDTGTNKLEVSKLDGSYRKTLISSNLDQPRDIILDVTQGLMYWTDWGSFPKIEKATMAGKQRGAVVNSGLQWPNGLTLDKENNRLYWVDGSYHKLEYLNLQTNSRVTLISSYFTLPHPFGLTVFKQYLYWTDWTLDAVYRANKHSGGQVTAFVSNLGQPMDIHGYNLSERVTPITEECNNNNGGCSELCLLTPLGKECACSAGLVLNEDGKSCHAPPQILLFADASNRKILKVSPFDSGSLASVPLPGYIYRPVALDYDLVEGRVYWTDVTRNTISRSFLNGTMQEVIIYKHLQTPDGLAVDPAGRNLYWTDTGTNKLEVSRLDGSYRKILITTGLDEPRDIILDVKKGIMYWTDWGSSPMIEKAEMTGKNRVVLVSSSLSWPNGLTLDQEKNWLYWVDASYDKLEYLNLNNNFRVTLIQSPSVLPHPFGLTLLGDYLYWTDWYHDALYRANKETGGDVTAFITGLGQPMDIHAYNLSERVTPGQCYYNNGGCSHLCLLSPSGRECACSDGLSLNDDGKTCHAPPHFLLFADATYGQIMKVSPYDFRSLHSLPLSSIISRPVALGYDVVEDRVYWTDVARQTISRSFLNGSSFEDIFYRMVVIPDGLAVDFIGRNLYWTDTGTNKLEVSKLDGSYRTTLIATDLDEPRDIILDVNKGTMYWTDWGSHPKIEKAEMTGKRRVVLVDSSLRWPNGLTLDQEKNRLYWVDASYDKLEYLDLNNNYRVTLIDSSFVLPHPFGLTLLGNYLYWTDWSRYAIYRAHKENGRNVTAFVSGIGQPMDIHGYNLTEHMFRVNSSCQLNNGGCSHICLLSPTGSECACPAHLSLKTDGKTCHTDFQKFLLFADGGGAQLFIQSLDGSYSGAGAVPIMPHFNVRRPVALDMDIRDNRIYWTDVSLNTISRVFINGSSPQVLVTVNVSNSDGLAVDPLGGNIYWTDTGVDKIEVSRLDGSMRKILIDQNLDEPRDIILHLNKGLMYWCDWGVDHKIEVANMDGTSRKLLVSRGLYWPNGLTLDHRNNWLYWVDAWNDILQYYDLERHTITTLIDSSSILPHPFGLTLLEDHLYWTDWVRDVVYRADKATPSSNFTIFARGLGQPMDIHAYDRNQTLPDHPCSSSYGGCSHLCLIRPDGYRCSCPDHLAPGDVCITSVVTSPTQSTQINTASGPIYSTPRTTIMTSSISTITIATSVPKSISSHTLSSSVFPTRVFPTERHTASSTTAAVTSVPAVSSHASSSPAIRTERHTASPTTAAATSVPAVSTHASSSPAVPTERHTAAPTTTAATSVPAVSTHTSSSLAVPTERHTASPTYQPPVTPIPTECRRGTCKNGGTCIIPGYFCNCKKYYVWRLCSVYVGKSAVEMEFSLKSEGGWSESLFKVAVAEACTKFFCSRGECASQSKSGRVKRSQEKPTFFRPSDIYILGSSIGAGNAWKVEFAVLFPSADGQPPQATAPEEVVQMVDVTKDNIGKAVGGTIHKATVVPEGKATQKPTQEPAIPPKKRKSTGDKETPVVPIAAGVGVSVVVIAILAAFIIYRFRSKRRPNDRTASDNIQMGQEWTNSTYSDISFDNPGFREEPVYDSLSAATGRALGTSVKQAKRGGALELRIPDEKGNNLDSKEPTYENNIEYESPNEAGRSNPTYGLPYPGEQEQYATPQERDTSYEALRPSSMVSGDFSGVANPLHDDEEYLRPVDVQIDFSHDQSDKVEENLYDDIKRKDDESQA